MFSDIPTFRAELTARLREALPAEWAIEKNIEAPNASLVPAVYIEFVGLDSTFQGKPVPHGTVVAETNVIITSPKTTAAGEDDVETHLVSLLAAIDDMEPSDIAWQSAQKQKVESNGAWSWRLTLYGFIDTTTSTTDTEE